jgi:hypothetical protein
MLRRAGPHFELCGNRQRRSPIAGTATGFMAVTRKPGLKRKTDGDRPRAQPPHPGRRARPNCGRPSPRVVSPYGHGWTTLRSKDAPFAAAAASRPVRLAARALAGALGATRDDRQGELRRMDTRRLVAARRLSRRARGSKWRPMWFATAHHQPDPALLLATSCRSTSPIDASLGTRETFLPSNNGRGIAAPRSNAPPLCLPPPRGGAPVGPRRKGTACAPICAGPRHPSR